MKAQATPEISTAYTFRADGVRLAYRHSVAGFIFPGNRERPRSREEVGLPTPEVMDVPTAEPQVVEAAIAAAVETGRL